MKNHQSKRLEENRNGTWIHPRNPSTPCFPRVRRKIKKVRIKSRPYLYSSNDKWNGKIPNLNGISMAQRLVKIMTYLSMVVPVVETAICTKRTKRPLHQSLNQRFNPKPKQHSRSERHSAQQPLPRSHLPHHHHNNNISTNMTTTTDHRVVLRMVWTWTVWPQSEVHKTNKW
eukprot:PhF_6_TR42796/c0_g1_i1/m.64761